MKELDDKKIFGLCKNATIWNWNEELDEILGDDNKIVMTIEKSNALYLMLLELTLTIFQYFRYRQWYWGRGIKYNHAFCLEEKKEMSWIYYAITAWSISLLPKICSNISEIFDREKREERKVLSLNGSLRRFITLLGKTARLQLSQWLK